MGLRMPSPYKHKSTGVYWYRQRVPAKVLIAAKGEIVSVTVTSVITNPTIGDFLKVSLATKDPAEAKIRASAVQGQFNAIWASFANPPTKLTFKEIVALAGEAFRGFEAFENSPGHPNQWREVLKANAAAFDGEPIFIGSDAARYLSSMKRRFGPFVDAVVRARQLRVDADTYRQLLEQFGRAMTDAAALLLKRSEADYSDDTRGMKYPAVTPRGSRKSSSGNPLTFEALIDHKQKTQSKKAATFDTYRAKLANFASFIGHDDAGRVTKDDARRWRDELIARGLAKKTINDQYLAALKTILNHAVKEFDLGTNVADLIRDERADPKPAPKGYSLEQGQTILAATFKGTRKSVSIPYQRANFWVPWICAYTGLRVGEVTQLQGTSLREDKGISFLVIRPEDGSTKGGNAWAVGIHKHLIELGLLDMLRAMGDGPAFYAPYPENTDLTLLKNHRSKDAADRIAEWVKTEVGVTAPLKRPSHAWRHTFTTATRDCEMDKEARDYMMGSRSKTDAREGYGDWSPAVLDREINKQPRYDVVEMDWRPTLELVKPLILKGTTPTKRIRKPPNRRKKAPASTP